MLVLVLPLRKYKCNEMSHGECLLHLFAKLLALGMLCLRSQLLHLYHSPIHLSDYHSSASEVLGASRLILSRWCRLCPWNDPTPAHHFAKQSAHAELTKGFQKRVLRDCKLAHQQLRLHPQCHLFSAGFLLRASLEHLKNAWPHHPQVMWMVA